MSESIQPSDKSVDKTSSLVAVLDNVLLRADAQRVVLGDIFLESSGLIYIPYAAYRSTKQIVTGAAALIGGVAGVVANALQEGHMEEVIPRAKQARKAEWGLPVEERAQKHGGGIRIERGAIRSLQTEGGIVVETAKKKYIFGYGFVEDGKANARVLEDWYSERLNMHPSTARVGLTIDYPPPRRLVDSFLSDRSEVSATDMERIAANEDYMEHLWAIFAKLRAKKRQQLLDRWRDQPEAFRSAISRMLQRKTALQGRTIIFTVIFGALSCAALPYAISGITDAIQHPNAPGSPGPVFAALFGLLFGIFFLAGIGAIWQKIRFARHWRSFADAEERVRMADEAQASKEEKIDVANTVIAGQILAGIINGIIFCGIGALLFSFIPSAQAGELQRGMTMGLWAFMGSYFSGALLAILINAPDNWKSGRSYICVMTAGAALAAAGYYSLNAAGLYIQSPDMSFVMLGGALGLILGAWVYYWLHGNLPFLFPFLGEAKRLADAEQRQRMKE